ncbi:chaperonin 10-like protein [Podospora didyma]|uniref:alcohol dehydrogenase n=1 Tax=Podospora didyma TaxID=330526 RepID=A0AAE0N646_9PEZI|nr:chaperonin 10-like protein [Podospora didyma]KAK3366365.1 chaperonin 10-like protein [Podospora didyma]KAK3372101.1 chaperonin 10-like protein [Podospora didyma]
MTPNIPKEQWAQVIETNGGPISYKQIPVQQPGPDQVLVNVKFSGVCHTDLHALNNDWPLPRKTPVVGGHEGAGVVVAKGSLVTSVNIGDNVGIKWLNSSCLNCSFCMQADESLCPYAELSGYTVDGSFQQYAVANAAHVARLPKDADLAAIAPILCAGLTVYKGLKESGARPGQMVAIVGAGGGLGNLAIQYAKAMGLHVVAIDGGSEKGEVCKKLGAASYVDFMTSKDLVKDVKTLSGAEGLGPHAVLLLAPQEKPFQQATDYVRSRGVVVCIGLPAHAKVSMPVFDTVVRMINVKGSYVGNRLDTAEALEFFNRGLIHAPYKVVGLSETQKVFDMMKENKIVGRYVLDMTR